MPAKKPTGVKVSQYELYALIAKNVKLPGRELTQKEIDKVMTAFQNTVMDQVYKGNNVALSIGTFKRADKAARKGRNPQTGESMKIAAKKAVKFQVGAKFSKHLNT